MIYENIPSKKLNEKSKLVGEKKKHPEHKFSATFFGSRNKDVTLQKFVNKVLMKIVFTKTNH